MINVWGMFSVMGLLFAATWLVTARLTPENALYARHMAMINGLLTVAIGLIIVSSVAYHRVIFAVAATLVVQSSFHLYIAAAVKFKQPHPSATVFWATSLAVGAICLSLNESHHNWRLALVSGIVGVAVITALQKSHRFEITEFGKTSTWIVHGPGLALGFALLCRSLWRVVGTTNVSQDLDTVNPQNLFLAYGILLTLSLYNFLGWGNLVHRLAAKLHELARHDALTGLANRRVISEALQLEKARYLRRHETFSLLSIDIDRFKTINDRFGHEGGDRALIRVAAVLRAHMRPTDVIARMGGEEFAVLLPQTDLLGAICAAERLRVRLPSEQLQLAGSTCDLTISVGVSACLSPADGIDALQKRADKALYSAKHAGRNRLVAQSESMFSEPAPLTSA